MAHLPGPVLRRGWTSSNFSRQQSLQTVKTQFWINGG